MSEELKSRVENILNSILGTVDPSELLPAQSRVEAILIALDAKIQELSELSGKIPIHICTSGEYNQLTGIPTIENPETDIFYLVPDGSGNNIYTEWIYTGDRWEYFSGQDQKIPSDIPAEVSSALLNIFRHVAYADNQGASLITNLERALYGIKPVRIEAVYNPPAGYVIYTDDDLDKVAAYLTVTEYYSDGSSVVVTDYTLTGTLVDGTSTLTVGYDELTTTVQVEAVDFYNRSVVEYPNSDKIVVVPGKQFDASNGNGYIKANANRSAVVATKGDVAMSSVATEYQPTDYYGIPFPNGATKATVEVSPATLYLYISEFHKVDGAASGLWRRETSNGWVQSGYTFTATQHYDGMVLGINIKENSAGNTPVTTVNYVKVTFS